jgi:SAM-dependent methyltransferase
MQTRLEDQRATRHAAFPAEAVTWLVSRPERMVVAIAHRELAAALVAAGHDVAAVPSRETGLPFHEHTIDTVVATDELPTDLDRVADLLRPGGRLTLVCQRRDHRIPWVRKLDAMLGHTPAAEPGAALQNSQRFGAVEEATFRWWQVVNQDSLASMLRAELAGHPATAREERVDRALALYADYGRGNDGMQMPWVMHCYKATVVDRIRSTAPGASSGSTGGSTAEFEAAAVPDDALLVIDFR